MTFFPSSRMENAGEYAQAYFGQVVQAQASIDGAAMSRAGELLVATASARGTMFSCGNGGSAAIANHLVCDCLKGVRNGSTLAPKVVSLSSNVELITAIANDIGVDEIFAHQVESLGEDGDLLIAISSSGSSPNIVAAMRAAKKRGMRVLAMTGFSGGEARSLADVSLHVDSHNYGVVEDVHQGLMHILAQYMRHAHLERPDDLGKLKF